MLINTRCTVCQQRIDSAETVVCGDCGKRIHEDCEEFERSFECSRCAEEREIGAVEF